MRKLPEFKTGKNIGSGLWLVDSYAVSPHGIVYLDIYAYHELYAKRKYLTSRVVV